MTVVIIILGVLVEGFRPAQAPMLAAHLGAQLMHGSAAADNLELVEVATVLSLLCYLCYGEPGYRNVRTSGPYRVGFKEFTTREMRNDCSVFYPVDTSEAVKIEAEGNHKTVHYCRYGSAVDGMRDVLDHSPFYSELAKCWLAIFLRSLSFVSVPVLWDAPMARVFSQGEKPVQVVIFSHGIGKDRMAYTGMLSELASHGMLVIAINHNDKSCLSTVGHEEEVKVDEASETNTDALTGTSRTEKRRQVIRYGIEMDFDDMSFRRLQLEIRESEIEALIK